MLAGQRRESALWRSQKIAGRCWSSGIYRRPKMWGQKKQYELGGFEGIDRNGVLLKEKPTYI